MINQFTYHHLSMNIDHEPPGFLSSTIICVMFGLLWKFIFSTFPHLLIAKAKECQIVLWVCLKPLSLEGLHYVFVHHLHCHILPIQYCLHKCTFWDTLRPQWNDNLSLPYINYNTIFANIIITLISMYPRILIKLKYAF